MAETVTTRERPLIMTAAEVRAIQADGKVTLRRPVSTSNSTVDGHSARQFWAHLLWGSEVPALVWIDRGFPDDDGVYRYRYLHVPARHPEDAEGFERQARVGCLWEPGDRLWGRETWALTRWWPECEDGHPVGGGDFDDWTGPLPPEKPPGWNVQWRADGSWVGYDTTEERGFRWRPPLAMPLWASRFTLEVESVGVDGRWEWVIEVRKTEG